MPPGTPTCNGHRLTHPRSLKNNSLGGYYDDEGDFQVDSSGIEKLSEALKSNSTLQTLEYAVACFHSYRQRRAR